jgi:hypothetical protein
VCPKKLWIQLNILTDKNLKLKGRNNVGKK